MKADVTNSLIRKHETEIAKLRESPNYRDDLAIANLRTELEGLRRKMEKVNVLARSLEEA